MIMEHEQIVLTADIPANGLKVGDVGTVVHVHRGGEAFEIEFMTLDGDTVAIATVPVSQVRAVNKRDLTHARPMQISA